VIDHLGIGRMAVLLVVALLVFGPERLPGIAAQAGRGLRQLRGTLDGLAAEIKGSVGPELADLDLTSLHPRTLFASLMAEDEPTAAGTLEPALDPALDPAFVVPEGPTADALLHAEVDLSTVEAELAALTAAHPAAAPQSAVHVEV
jgi:sec-independent protein translocase protein TatB